MIDFVRANAFDHPMVLTVRCIKRGFLTVENLIKGNNSEDSRASWNEHPNRVSAVQFQDDTNFERDDKHEVQSAHYSYFLLQLRYLNSHIAYWLA